VFDSVRLLDLCLVVVCKDVPKAKALFDEASEILGYDLLQICTEGPKEKLDSTVVSQPAIFVASMAAVEKLREEQGQDAVDAATCAMGLSLGEYSALCFAGAISFADGVKVTKARGEAMQAASDAIDTGMVSVIGLDKEKTTELCKAASAKSGEKIQIANLLCNGNYAVSGHMKACDTVAEIAKPDFRARMTVLSGLTVKCVYFLNFFFGGCSFFLSFPLVCFLFASLAGSSFTFALINVPTESTL
jgi:[acyl-carrier-protein] S-malonyltransferase